jgi:hypothetical protein
MDRHGFTNTGRIHVWVYRVARTRAKLIQKPPTLHEPRYKVFCTALGLRCIVQLTGLVFITFFGFQGYVRSLMCSTEDGIVIHADAVWKRQPLVRQTETVGKHKRR